MLYRRAARCTGPNTPGLAAYKLALFLEKRRCGYDAIGSPLA